MNNNIIINNYTAILTKDELSRIIATTKKGSDKTIVFVDVHGFKVSEAKTFLNKIIKSYRPAFHLIINHGYHRHAIKDFLFEKKLNARIIWQTENRNNPGLTHMEIQAIA